MKYILFFIVGLILFSFVSAETVLSIFGLRAENIAGSGAQIKWTTNIASDSKIFYGTSTSYGLLSNSRCDGGGYVAEHCINLIGLSYGTVYYYKVESFPSGCSTSGCVAYGASSFISGTSSGGSGGGGGDGGSIPVAPSMVSAGQSDSSVGIGWTMVSDATHYNVYRSVNSGSYSWIYGPTGANSTTYIDTAVTSGYAYRYKVEACKSGYGCSSQTESNSVALTLSTTIPTPTPTYSPTPTPTPALSYSPTPTPIPIASYSPSPTPTINYSPTPTPKPTYSPTPTPTPSYSPTPTPTVNATVIGKVIDSQGMAVAGAWYHLFREDYGLNFDGTTDSGGYFKVTVPAGFYVAEVFPSKTSPNLLRSEPQKFSISGGETKSLIFKFESGSKKVTGTVLFFGGQPVVNAEVGAYSKDTGQWVSTMADQNGKYVLKVSGGRWEVGVRPKDGAGDWFFAGPYPVAEFYQDAMAETKEINFSIPTADAKLIIRTVDNEGRVLPYVGVVVDVAGAGQYSTTSFVGQSQFAKSDSNGLAIFSLKPGSYYVRTYLPDELGYINPSEQSISIKSGETNDIKMVFIKRDQATAVFIKGTTKLEDGRPVDAYVWAWSEKGGFSNTRSDSNGLFVLQIMPNSGWHISAGKEFEGLAYKSSEVVVPVGGSSTFVEIVLSKFSEVPLPKPATITSTSSQQIIAQTSDGAKLFVPPDATASSVGNLTVEVKPTIEAPSQAAAKVIGTAYDVVIKNQAGQELKTFEKELEIILPYDEANIKSQGLTEDSISPSYYDEGTGAWVRADNYTIDKEKNVIIVRTKHLTRYAIVAAADIVPPADVTSVSGAALGGGKIRLAWTNPTKDFSHVKIYQSETAGSLGKIAASEIVGNEYVDEGVTNSITYYYSIRSVDPAGNESATTKQTAVKAIGTSSQKPAIYGLNDGDVVSAAGSDDSDVYIVNIYGYKRLFLNPIIFNFYGHLGGFGKVKNVTGTTRDKFGTSGLFRNCETNDPKVYGVEATGEDAGILHWVNTTGEQAVADDPVFFKKVFCINSREFNWYQKGSDYTSVNQIPIYLRK